MDSLVQKARAAIIDHGLIPPGAAVLAGVSGGADSVALLHVLWGLRAELGYALYAAHLNHCIRGEEAEADEAYVAELCRGLGVELIVGRADIPALARAQGKTLEQAARDGRYAFLEGAMAKCGASRVAVAHHMEDQAESVLLHLMRGSGTAGLAGMRHRRGDIIRPFLGARRGEIEEYLHSRGIPYRTDSTNLKRDASRNRIRLDLIPYIEEHFNPAFVECICSASELVGLDEAYLAEQAQLALDSAATGQGYDRRAIAGLPWPIRSRALRLALSRAGAKADVERKHVELLDGLLSARTGVSLDLPHACAWASNESLCIGPRPLAAEPFEAPFNPEGRTELPGGYYLAERVQGGIIKDKNIGVMDLDRLPEGLAVRPRRPGDRFHPLGAPGSKKLKDFFIDRKAPRQARETPILFAGREALFIPGFGIAEGAKVTEGTGRMIKVTYHRTGE